MRKTIKYKENGKYTKEEVEQLLREIDFNHEVLDFLKGETSGWHKYICVVPDEEGNAKITSSERMTRNTQWQNQEQVIADVHGQAETFPHSYFDEGLEFRLTEDGDKEYFIDGRWVEYDELVQDILDTVDLEDDKAKWVQQMVELWDEQE